MKYERLDNNIFVSHRKSLVDLLEEGDLALFFSNDEMPKSGDQNFPFHQQADLFYLTGIDQAETILALCPTHSNPALREVLFIAESNAQQAVWQGNKLSKMQAETISGITTIYYLSQKNAVLQEMITESKTLCFNIEEHARYTTKVVTSNCRQANEIMHQYPLHQRKRLAPIMEMLRLRKSAQEVELIQKACDITAATFLDILPKIQSRIGEYEIEGAIIGGFLARKATGCSFAPIVATGANACILHYTENSNICQSGDLLLIDMGAEYAHYAGDLSRTIPVNGKFTPRQTQVYQACEEVFRYARTLYVPGMTINKMQNLVLEFMQSQLQKLGLITAKEIEQETIKYASVKRYYMHGLAHFVGLDVHDVGTKDEILDYGMVLSCEPGIYIPKENIGIRIETVMLVNDTPIDLMPNVPLTVKEIELLMNKKQ